MAMTFRGEIPDWLNPETAGHPHRDPPGVPVQVAGRDYFYNASATYALAPHHERQSLLIAAGDLRALNVPMDPDRSNTLQYVEHLYADMPNVMPLETREFQAWLRWTIAISNAKAQFNFMLLDGGVRAFGEPDRPHSHPQWIDPLLWLRTGLKADPGIPGKFAGHGLVFWNVRVVRALEVMEEAEKRDAPAKESQKFTVNPHPNSAECATWFADRVQCYVNASRHPTEKADLEAAEEHFGCKVQREVIRSLRAQYVPAHRRRQGPSTS